MTSPDVIDALAGLKPATATWSARHERPKVVAATQASFAALFDPALGSLPLDTRYLVAALVCRLTGMDEMAAFYRAKVSGHAVLGAVDANDLDAIDDAQLRSALIFAQKLTQNPVEGDKMAIEALKSDGLSDQAIVTLGQLIGFLSYQTRLVAGLSALAQGDAQ